MVGLLACWERLDTLPELEGVALLVLLEPLWLALAQKASLEVGPLAFPVVSNCVLKLVVALLECQLQHHSILHRMQQESWALLVVYPNGLVSWACRSRQRQISS